VYHTPKQGPAGGYFTVHLGRKSGRFTNPFVLTGPVRTFWKKENPLLLRVTYVDVDTVIGMLNENLPKVRSKLVPQSKPKHDNTIIQQSGNLAPIKEKEQQELLQKEQELIQGFEQQIQQKLQVKREELLKPIVDKITAKIKEVCTENKFVMVFDTSSFNALLFTPDSEDITALVRTKMLVVPATK
jgi:outer membrane protein